jgi:hypothetical protein
LTVCGRPEKEADFFTEYRRELTQLPNIHFAGWTAMGSPEFQRIRETHGAVLYPSCSEGGAGSVIHCMHAGLVPIVTHEASVDIEDFGISIESDKVEAIKQSAMAFASLTPQEAESRMRASWESVRRNHTRARFRRDYENWARLLAGQA